MGLGSYEWLSTLDKMTIDDFLYEDFCEAADRISDVLRREHNCHFIVALTHMRQPDDELLASSAKDIDLILGGHDHVLLKKLIKGRWSVKSGTDFKVCRLGDRHFCVDTPPYYKLTEHPQHFGLLLLA